MKLLILFAVLAGCDLSDDKKLAERGQAFGTEVAKAALAKEAQKAVFLARNGASKGELCVQVDLVKRLAVEANDEEAYNAWRKAGESCP